MTTMTRQYHTTQDTTRQQQHNRRQHMTITQPTIDFILLSLDILDEDAVAAVKLHEVECLTTYFCGEVIFDRSAFKDSDDTAVIAGVL